MRWSFAGMVLCWALAAACWAGPSWAEGTENAGDTVGKGSDKAPVTDSQDTAKKVKKTKMGVTPNGFKTTKPAAKDDSDDGERDIEFLRCPQGHRNVHAVSDPSFGSSGSVNQVMFETRRGPSVDTDKVLPSGEVQDTHVTGGKPVEITVNGKPVERQKHGVGEINHAGQSPAASSGATKK